MPYYRRLGSIPPQRHTMHRVSPGYKGEGIYYEEVVTTRGFSRAYSIVYHLAADTRQKVEPAGGRRSRSSLDLPLRHVHTKSGAMPTRGDPVTGRVPVFANADVIMSRCRPNEPQARVVPQRHGRRDHLRPPRQRPAADHVRRSADQAVRLCRDPAHDDLPVGIRQREPARPARHRGDRQHRVPAAIPEPGRPVPHGRSVRRARPAWPDAKRSSSTASKTRRS